MIDNLIHMYMYDGYDDNRCTAGFCAKFLFTAKSSALLLYDFLGQHIIKNTQYPYMVSC